MTTYAVRLSVTLSVQADDEDEANRKALNWLGNSRPPGISQRTTWQVEIQETY